MLAVISLCVFLQVFVTQFLLVGAKLPYRLGEGEVVNYLIENEVMS
jgi:hypothetical protein